MHSNDRNLDIGGISVSELARTYGTPLYVYDADKIRDNYRRVLRTFRKYYRNFALYYAIKACSNLEVANILVTEGAGIDAASINEVMLARALGLSGDQIIFTGNNLSDDDIQAGLSSGAVFNIDDISILDRVFSFGRPEVISFRINPGEVSGHYNTLLHFDGAQAKFGIHPDQAVDAYHKAKRAGVSRFGIHTMPGSCTLEPAYFHVVTELLFEIISDVVANLNVEFEFIDLGGGLGIPYTDDAKPLDLESTAKGVTETVREKCGQIGLREPRLVMEPARFFVGNAGYLIGKIHSIKSSYKVIIGTDISMNTLARPVMYGAHHRIRIDGKEGDPTFTAGLCGQVCENTDYWVKDRQFPSTVEVGDVVVVYDAGAYGYAMSYQYNGRLRPAEVLIQGGQHRLIRRRENFEDLVANMVLSPDLEHRVKSLGT